MVDPASPAEATASNRDAALFHAAPFICAALAALFYSQFLLTHDSSWYLVATRKFLEGDRLYLDILEINPPLNFYLTVPALIMSDLTGISETVSYTLYYCLLSAFSGLWAARILNRSALERRERHLMLMAGLIGLFLLPISEFTQREHIMLIFALPYFYLCIVGPEQVRMGAAEQFAIGLVSALGLALKPYFLLVPAFLALAGPPTALFRRTFAPGNLGLALGLIIYALFVIFAHFEYFSEIIPVATRIYGDFGLSWGKVVFRKETIALILFVPLVLRKGMPVDPISWRLIAAATGALAVYLVQFKGWNYQALPFSFFLLLGALWIALRKDIVKRRDVLSTLLVIAIAAFTVGTQIDRGPYDAEKVKPFSSFIGSEAPHILVYSTNVSSGFPFTNTVGGQWSSRFPAQWVIPGAVIGLHETDCSKAVKTCSELQAILDFGRRANADDFLRYRPEYVFVDIKDRKSYFGGIAFDYIDFMKADPRFARAWEHCRNIGMVEEFEYDVWSCAHPAIGDDAR